MHLDSLRAMGAGKIFTTVSVDCPDDACVGDLIEKINRSVHERYGKGEVIFFYFRDNRYNVTDESVKSLTLREIGITPGQDYSSFNAILKK